MRETWIRGTGAVPDSGRDRGRREARSRGERPPRARSRRRRGRTARAAAIGTLVVAALVAAGCSNSPSSSGSSTSSTTAGLSAAAVRALQTALAAVGCYSGPVDGQLGPATTSGLRQFQSLDGLTADGVYGGSTKAKLLAAAQAGSKICSSATSTTTTPASTSTTAAGVPSAATAAIDRYEAANGPPAGSWVITTARLSTVDPSYVYFAIGPAPGYQDSVQGGYGIAHETGGTWSVIGFGSAGVGCTSGPQTPAVPTAVLTGFGLTCPSS